MVTCQPVADGNNQDGVRCEEQDGIADMKQSISYASPNRYSMTCRARAGFEEWQWWIEGQTVIRKTACGSSLNLVTGELDSMVICSKVHDSVATCANHDGVLK